MRKIFYLKKKVKKNTLVLDKKNTREKINEEKMKNHVRKGYKGKINKKKKKCGTCLNFMTN